MKMKTNSAQTIAIQNIRNPKQYKYAENILEDFTQENKINQSMFGREKEAVTRIKIKYLEKMVKLAKANQADTLDLYIAGEDKPLNAVLYHNSDQRLEGHIILAPVVANDNVKQERKEYQVMKNL